MRHFVNFSSFPYFLFCFWTVCLILMHQAPNAPKNIQKYICDVKFPVLSNAAGRIGLNIEEKPENWKNLYFWKSHNAKTPFSNLLKLCREVENYMYFWTVNSPERYRGLENCDRRFSSIFRNSPSLFGRFLRFPSLSLHGNPILSSEFVSSSNFTLILVVSIFF